jgi:hypothetical protein
LNKIESNVKQFVAGETSPLTVGGVIQGARKVAESFILEWIGMTVFQIPTAPWLLTRAALNIKTPGWVGLDLSHQFGHGVGRILYQVLAYNNLLTQGAYIGLRVAAGSLLLAFPAAWQEHVIRRADGMIQDAAIDTVLKVYTRSGKAIVSTAATLGGFATGIWSVVGPFVDIYNGLKSENWMQTAEGAAAATGQEVLDFNVWLFQQVYEPWVKAGSDLFFGNPLLYGTVAAALGAGAILKILQGYGKYQSFSGAREAKTPEEKLQVVQRIDGAVEGFWSKFNAVLTIHVNKMWTDPATVAAIGSFETFISPAMFLGYLIFLSHFTDEPEVATEMKKVETVIGKENAQQIRALVEPIAKEAVPETKSAVDDIDKINSKVDLDVQNRVGPVKRKAEPSSAFQSKRVKNALSRSRFQKLNVLF